MSEPQSPFVERRGRARARIAAHRWAEPLTTTQSAFSGGRPAQHPGDPHEVGWATDPAPGTNPGATWRPGARHTVLTASPEGSRTRHEQGTPPHRRTPPQDRSATRPKPQVDRRQYTDRSGLALPPALVWGALALSAVVWFTRALPTPEWVRVWATVAFVLVAPGTSLARLLGLTDRAVRAPVIVGLGLVAGLACAQSLVMIGRMSGTTGLLALTALTVPGLVLALLRPDRRPTQPTRPTLPVPPQSGLAGRTPAVAGRAPSNLAGRLQPLTDHLADPLFRNAYALILSTALSTLMGVGYWVAAARLYPPEAVGRGQATLNLIALLSGAGSFRAVSVLTRFLPRSGRYAGSMIAHTYLASALASFVVTIVVSLTLRGPLGISTLTGSGLGPTLALALAVTVWSVFVAQDGALTGLRSAIWVPVENLAHAFAKLALLVALVPIDSPNGVTWSWMIPTLLAIPPVSWLIHTRLLPKHIRAAHNRSLAPSLEGMVRFVGAEWVTTLFELAVLNLPLLIVNRQSGPRIAGYFGIAWVIGTTLDQVVVHLGSSLTVEGARDQAGLSERVRSLLHRSAMIVVPAAVGVALFAGVGLTLFGGEYAQRSTTLLRLLGLALIPRMVCVVVAVVARLSGHYRLVVGIQGAVATITLGLALVLLNPLGPVAFGWSYLIATTVVGLALTPSLLGYLRGSTRIRVMSSTDDGLSWLERTYR